MKYIQHITLNTGHTSRSPIKDVDPAVRASLRPLIQQAKDGHRVTLPSGKPTCTLKGASHGRCVLLNVAGPPLPQNVAAGSGQGMPVPLVEIGIAPHSRCGNVLWSHMHDFASMLGLSVATDRDRCPSEPWVAALVLPSLQFHVETAVWLGDLERSLAWAWLEKRKHMH